MKYFLYFNLEITGIPNNVSDQNLEEKVIEVISDTQVNLSNSDIEPYHCIGKSTNYLALGV